jgi:hypothetical protein
VDLLVVMITFVEELLPVLPSKERTGDCTDNYGEVMNTNDHLDLLSHNLAVGGRKWSL